MDKDEQSGWWNGLKDTGETGYFPSNYTDLNERELEDEPAADPNATPASS